MKLVCRSKPRTYSLEGHVRNLDKQVISRDLEIIAFFLLVIKIFFIKNDVTLAFIYYFLVSDLTQKALRNFQSYNLILFH